MKIDGVKVADAKKKLKIEIIPLDIKSASKKRPDCCAIAKACKRQFPIKEIRVHLSRIYMRDNADKWTRFLTPKALRTEIIAFDRGGVFEPGTYTLPKPHATTGKRQGTTTNDHNKRYKIKKRKRHVVTNVRPSAL